MCGIAGYSCTKDYDERLNIAMPILALYMENRGRRSWGWTDGDKQIVKELGEISDGYNPSFFGYSQAALHTRQPTTGATVKENSHPFRVGNVIGMHNGVVRNHDELQNKYSRTCAVDSEHIFHHINENIDLGDIQAYGAIVFWQDGKLHLGRFNSGDLTLVKTKNAWVFASTKSSLQVALRMAGLLDGAVFFKLKENRLYTIQGDKLVKDRKLNFGEYDTKKHGDWRTNSSSSYTPTEDDYAEGWFNNYGRHVPRLPAAGTTLVNPSLEENRTPSMAQVSEFMGVDERIKAMIEDAASRTEKHSHVGESISCGFCNVKLFNRDPYYMTDDADLCCVDCAAKNKDSIIGERLMTLPRDSGLVGSFFAEMRPEDAVCDECAEQMDSADYFVLTIEGTYVCLQCFTYEEETDGTDDIVTCCEDVASLEEDEMQAADTAYQQRAAEHLDRLIDETQDRKIIEFPIVRTQIQ